METHYFDLSKNIAFSNLFNLCNKKSKLNINDLGYFIGPILNAGGRLGKSNFAIVVPNTICDIFTSFISSIISPRINTPRISPGGVAVQTGFLLLSAFTLPSWFLSLPAGRFLRCCRSGR